MLDQGIIDYTETETSQNFSRKPVTTNAYKELFAHTLNRIAVIVCSFLCQTF